MKVQELVEMYNKNQRIDIEKKIETRKYVGIEFKQRMAQLVLDNCTTVIDGEVHIDSVERYILFTISVISMHTNLEFVDNEAENHSALDDYDLLCESGLLVKIIDTFKDDYASCQEILNMMTADRMQDSMTIERKINSLLDSVQNTLGGALGNLMEKINIDDLLGVPSIDQGKLMDIYNLIK